MNNRTNGRRTAQPDVGYCLGALDFGTKAIRFDLYLVAMLTSLRLTGSI